MRALAYGLIVASVVLAGYATMAQTASAGHVKGVNCQSSPRFCRWTWSTPNTVVNIRTWDQFSTPPPGYSPSGSYWSTAASNAVSSWHNKGPIRTSWGALSSDSYHYYKWGQTGYGGLDDGDWATNWNCRYSDGWCSNGQDTAMIVWWSESYMNTTQSFHNNGTYLNPMHSTGTPYVWQKVFAHELGHALGLKHHQANDHVMRTGATDYSGAHPNGPMDPQDVGQFVNPACSGASGDKGIRCTYLWTLN